jgi:hypothetical protein
MVADLVRFLIALATTRQSAKRRVVGLLSCRPVSSDNAIKRQTVCCRLVVLSLARHAKRCVVVRCVVAMSLGL